METKNLSQASDLFNVGLEYGRTKAKQILRRTSAMHKTISEAIRFHEGRRDTLLKQECPGSSQIQSGIIHGLREYLNFE